MWCMLQGTREEVEAKILSLFYRIGFVIVRQGEISTIDEKGAYMSSCSGLVNCRLIIKM